MKRLNFGTGIRIAVAVLFLAFSVTGAASAQTEVGTFEFGTSMFEGPGDITFDPAFEDTAYEYFGDGESDIDFAYDIEDFAYDIGEDFAYDIDDDFMLNGDYEKPLPFEDDREYVTISGILKDSNGQLLQNIWINAEPEYVEYYDDEEKPGLDENYGDYDNDEKPEPAGDGSEKPEFEEGLRPESGIIECFPMPWIPGGGGETNENGEFSISVVQGHRYDLFVNIKSLSDVNALGGFFLDADGGSGSDPGADALWSGSTTHDWAERTVIEVNEEGISNVSITLGKGSRIYGKALDSEGSPLGDLWIDVSSDLPGGWGGDSTDEEGNFSIVVPPGEGYRISSWPWTGGFLGGYWKVGHDNSLTTSGSLTPIWNEATLLDASADVEINIIFDGGNTISGRVLDEAGHPVFEMWVNAATGIRNPDLLRPVYDEKEEYKKDEMFFSEPQPEPLWYGASTDEDGYYEISVYPTLDYRVSVSGNDIYRTIYYKDALTWEDSTPVDASDSVAGIDFTLKMGPGIAGTLSGLEADDVAYIEVWSDSGRGWGNTKMRGTGSDISFKVRGLVEGSDYRINVWAEGYLNGYVIKDGMLGTYEQAALFKAGAEDVKIELSTGKKISGTLSGLSEGDIVWIDAYSESGWSKSGMEVRAEGDTADFTLSGLGNASDFRVSVHSDGYINGYYSGAGSVPVTWDQAKLISTVDGDATGINIAMSTGNSISGSVSGLDEGVWTWISAWSDTAGSYGGVEVIGTGDDVPYEITCLSPGSDFRVSISAEGYIGGYYSTEGTVEWDAADMIDSSTNPTDINLALSKGKTISGTITGLGKGEWAWIEVRQENENPFTDPMPLKMDDAMSSNGWCGTGWGERYWGGTSVRGTGEPVRYTITGLAAADDFLVTFQPDGYAKETRTGVDSSADPADIDFVVSEGNRISGTITGAAPNQWVSVNAWSEKTRDGRYAQVKTDADGKAVYEMKGLGNAADYVVNAWSGRKNLFYNQQMSWEDAIRVDLSQGSAEGINFDFDAIKMYVISGTIAGLPEEGKTMAWIDAWSETTGAWGGKEVYGNGEFSIEVPAGDYKVGIYADAYVKAYYDAASGTLTDNWAAAEPVTVNADKDLGVLMLSAGYSISGVVTDSEGGAVGRVWVNAHNNVTGVSTNAVTNRRGEYRISGLSDGTYSISLWSLAGYHEGEVTIEGSDVAYNISLGGEDTGDMSGVVDGGDIVMLFDSDDNFVNAIEADASGNYAFKGLAVGNYTVKVRKDAGEDEDHKAMDDTFSVNVSANPVRP